MRRCPLLLLLAILATATGIGLLSLGLLVVSPPPVGSSRLATLSLTTYLAAVNQALQTGDLTLVNQAVADDFVEHSPSAVFGSDRAGLGRSLLALRSTFPDLQFAAEDTITEGSLVSTRLHATGHQVPSVLGLTLPDGPSAWTTLDLFRIKHGQIVEHWSDGHGIDLFSPLATNAGDLSIHSVTTIAVARLTATGAPPRPLTLPGDTLVVVETGAVHIQTSPTWQLARSPEGTAVASAQERDFVLRGGESRFVPIGSSVLVTTDELTTLIAAVAITTESRPRGEPPPGTDLVDALMTSPSNGPVTIAGIRIDGLVRVRPPATVRTTVTLSLGQAVLQAHHAVHLDARPGTRGVVVVAGSVAVGPTDGRLEIHQSAPNGEASPSILLGESVTLAPGDGAVAPTDVPLQVRNHTDGPALVFIVIVSPHDDSIAPPVSIEATTPTPRSASAATPDSGDNRGGPH